MLTKKLLNIHSKVTHNHQNVQRTHMHMDHNLTWEYIGYQLGEWTRTSTLQGVYWVVQRELHRLAWEHVSNSAQSDRKQKVSLPLQYQKIELSHLKQCDFKSKTLLKKMKIGNMKNVLNSNINTTRNTYHEEAPNQDIVLSVHEFVFYLDHTLLLTREAISDGFHGRG